MHKVNFHYQKNVFEVSNVQHNASLLDILKKHNVLNKINILALTTNDAIIDLNYNITRGL